MTEVFTINGEGIRRLVEAHAEQTGESVDAFMMRAILNTIDMDKKQERR